MAYANARVQSLGATTSPRPASLIDGHRFASRNAVRARLPCGCLTHKHSCRKHAVTAAHARCQGSTSVGALSTACPATPQSCKGVNGQLFASAARPSKRSASVSSTVLLTVSASCLPRQRPCRYLQTYTTAGRPSAPKFVSYALQHKLLAHRGFARKHLTVCTLHQVNTGS